MTINPNPRYQQQALEAMRYVSIEDDASFPAVTASSGDIYAKTAQLVYVLNPGGSSTTSASAVSITNPVTAVSITNPVTAVSITNPVTAVSITTPVSVSTVGNITTKFREAFETYSPGNRWTQSLDSGDLVFVDGNAAAASYLVVSKNPLIADTQTTIESIALFDMPIEMVCGASMSQRTLGQEFALELVDSATPLPSAADVGIDSIIQSATTLTVTTLNAHNLSVGRAVGIRGCLDSRVNYPALVVASVLSPTQFTATAGPNGTIVSQSSYLGTVLAATTGALPANTYANGASGVGATLTASANGVFPNQDGVTIPLNGRVLVKNESTGANNGVYALTQVGSVSTPWILTRVTDFDTAAEMTVVAGVLLAVAVHVAGGSTQALRKYYLRETVTTVGTTSVLFVDAGTPAIGPAGFVFQRERLGRAINGVSQIFENTTATNASLYIRSESGDALPSGAIASNHSATIGTTASIQLAGSVPYTYSFSPTNEYRIVMQADRTQWSDQTIDSIAASTNRLNRMQICPSPAATYRLRIRANNAKSLTVPNAQVISVAKSGTTVGTFTTDVPHGYTTGDLVVYYGSSDTAAAAFPNLATATAVTATGSNTFAAIIGSGTTGVAYGGFVAKVQAGNLMSSLGVTTQTVVSAALTTLSDNTRQLVLNGNGTWAGVSIGDLVNVIGVRSVAGLGTTLGVDGVWRAANLSSAVLTLVGLSGQSWPADFGLTWCGGSVIRRTDLRLSYIRVFDFDRQRVELLARPAGDIAAAAPVTVQNTPAVNITNTVTTVSTVTTLNGGAVAEDAATTNNPLIVGGVVRTAVAPTTLVAGDAARLTMTAGAAAVNHPYSIPELSWQTPAVVNGIVNTTTPFVIKEAAGALLCNYVTSIDLFSEALTNATDLRIREPDLTCSTQTVSSNALTATAAHNLRVNDAVVFSATTVPALTANATYFVTSIPTTTSFTVGTTRGGATQALTGINVTATVHKVLWQTRIPTTGAAPRQITFPVPLRGSINTATQVQTVSASGAGAVFISAQGFAAQ